MTAEADSNAQLTSLQEADEWSDHSVPHKEAACTPEHIPGNDDPNSYTRAFTEVMSEKNWKKCEGPVPAQIFKKSNSVIAAMQTNLSSNSPNVIVLMVDALSRAHASRSLPKTLKWMKDNGATSLGRYHITGFHSEDNQFPLVAGVHYGMKTNPETYIWNRAKKLGYITQYASTARIIAKLANRKDFHYWNHQPGLNFDKNRGFCMGSKQASDVALDSVVGFFEAYPGVPKLSYSYFEESHWWKPVSVEGIYSTVLDDPFESFFRRLPEKEKTAIVLMSDHGFIFWEQRIKSPMVALEHRLPLAVLKLPANLGNGYLNDNIWKLTTPFDMHETLLSIIGQTGQSDLGLNLLSHVPQSRSCNAAGIPIKYCICANNDRVNPPQILIDAAMTFINSKGHSRDPNFCRRLSFVKFQKNITENYQIHLAPGESIYTFFIGTNYDRIFECTVYYNENDKTNAKQAVSRVRVQSVQQLSHYTPAEVCSLKLAKDPHPPGVVAKSLQYCACPEAFGSE